MERQFTIALCWGDLAENLRARLAQNSFLRQGKRASDYSRGKGRQGKSRG